MNKFKVGDKVVYEWYMIPGVYIITEVLKVYKTTDGYHYVVSGGATVPEKALIKIDE